MATSPSLTIGGISNAVITDQGTSVSMGKISWSVAEQAESDFAANKNNYSMDTSEWPSRYYWSAKSGTTNFNGLNNNVTVSTQVTVYTKSIVVSSSGTFVGLYSDEPSAKSACDGVSGSASYIYSYSYGNSPVDGALGYCVYRYDLSVTTTSSAVTLTASVDVSGYIIVQPTLPQPTYAVSYTYNSATATISNLSAGDSVVFTIYNSGNGSYITSTSGTASGASITLTVSGLSASTGYSALVTVNGLSLGYINFTTNAAPQPSQTYSVSYSKNTITVNISNLSVGDTAWFYLRETQDVSGSLPSYRALSYTRSSTSDSSSHVWTETVEYGVSYTYSIVVQPGDIYLVSGAEFTLTDGSFQWDTNIQAGAKMSTKMIQGVHYPAPVTALEWNRLVSLVNKKCGTSIAEVVSGQSMYAGDGKNVRLVADALGVSVSRGDIITAQFFLDLRDAVNSL